MRRGPGPGTVDVQVADGTGATALSLQEGPRSVAAPVRGRDGEVVAGVDIPVHAGRNSVESVGSVRRDLLPHLLATVARIEADLAMATGRGRAADHGTGTHR